MEDMLPPAGSEKLRFKVILSRTFRKQLTLNFKISRNVMHARMTIQYKPIPDIPSTVEQLHTVRDKYYSTCVSLMKHVKV